MGFGQKSWDGQNILIFAREPLVAGNLQEKIAVAAPFLEPLLESFEDYFDALDHCKAEKKVGFILVLEDALSPSIRDVVKNLLNPFRQSGWPGFACLVHKDSPSILGHRLKAEDNAFIGYHSLSDFSSIESCQLTLTKLWDEFVKHNEKALLDGRFRTTLMDKAIQCIGQDSLKLRHTLFHLLSQNLDLSWRDHFSINWSKLIQEVETVDKMFFSSHEDLSKISKRFLASVPAINQHSVQQTLGKDLPLPVRIELTIELFCQAYKRGDLSLLLADYEAQKQLATSGLFKNIIRSQQKILIFEKSKKKAS